MSQVYSTEPETTGEVTIHFQGGSYGPIDIFLFCRECPKTTRLFLQMCMDGYYEGLVFGHRILKDFLIQSGDFRSRSNTNESSNNTKKKKKGWKEEENSTSGQVGEGLEMTKERRQNYLKYFQDIGWYWWKEESTNNDISSTEMVSRIRFNHRGQVAIARQGSSSSSTSESNEQELQGQFFITLDECPSLQNEHIVFGTMKGPTIFNLLRMANRVVGENDDDEINLLNNSDEDLITDAPRIQRIEIKHHIFEDLKPRNDGDIPWKSNNQQKKKASNKNKKKRKGKRDLNVLSFGNDEEQDGEELIVPKGGRMLSSHDVLKSTKNKKSKKMKKQEDTSQQKKDIVPKDVSEDISNNNNNNENLIPKASNKPPFGEKDEENSSGKDKKVEKYDESTVDRTTGSSDNNNAPNDQDKKSSIVSDTNSATLTSKKKKKKPVSYLELRRAKYANSSKKNKNDVDKKKRDEDTLAKLSAFRSKMKNQPSKSVF